MRVDEAVFVATNQGGEPIGFNWRGIAYLVKSRPVRWFARREWWVEASRVHRGIGAGVVEVEMWRLQAKNVDPQAASESSGGQFELIHSADDNVWRLVHVWQ
ncbi:MAG: hypothetical protein RL605_295 [Actinomycetota bacterium]|jgi:hypothetical protein